MLSDRIYVMGGRPGSIVSTINIEKDKINVRTIILQKNFWNIKRNIV